MEYAGISPGNGVSFIGIRTDHDAAVDGRVVRRGAHARLPPPPFPGAARTGAMLLVAIVGVVAVGVVLGRLLVGPLGTWLARDVDGPARTASIDHANSTVSDVAHRVSPLGNAVITGFVAAVIAAGWYARTRNRRPALVLIATFTGAAVVTLLVKYGVHRSPAYGPTTPLRPGAFPSGHTLFALAVFGTLAVLLVRATRLPGVVRWLAAVALLMVPLAVGFARVYLLDHYLSDVVGSLILGTLLIAGVVTVLARVDGPLRPG
jgi:undecaprenyl-diphosphatase